MPCILPGEHQWALTWSFRRWGAGAWLRKRRGAGGCAGHYVLQDGLLTLFWDDWAPEALEKNGSGFSCGPFSLTPAAGSRQLPFPESVS